MGLLGVVVVMVVDVVVAGTPIEVEKKLVSIEMKENEKKNLPRAFVWAQFVAASLHLSPYLVWALNTSRASILVA